MKSDGSISIWFFIGISLVVNGILILGAGLYEYAHPPANPVVLFRLHASIWWGALLFLLGLVYCFHFNPTKTAAKS
jgi:FtsH-binding integral membrane protein